MMATRYIISLNIVVLSSIENLLKNELTNFIQKSYAKNLTKFTR